MYLILPDVGDAGLLPGGDVQRVPFPIAGPETAPSVHRGSSHMQVVSITLL